MNYKDDLSSGKNLPETFNVVVEIPKGSQNKYEYDSDLGAFKLDRVLFSPLHYPGDYGFVPQTLFTDGDPLDALVLVTFPTYPGMVIEVRAIGLLEFNDNGEADDKVLCVPVHDIRFETVHDIADIQEPILNEIAHFFMVYKHLEGKKSDVQGWHGKERAKEILLESVERYKQK
ncbi:inorganic diphosphatase [Candidatus Peregrinibacteria bacterium CG10_big_fil_rev_8_21_14_0_10_49_24]|nr:MAG: inorganic diphosphatase [Candidatus Peregrinibacteria bacterium CG11_big_fil_rev_8_21_14_0_20_49_14]PIR51124.1 MAG: inorganic diphosphatase [Candidatus Peregrinibacteria bacterium CG10_big_fil_rev_8_21_14_0_10_49_24]